MQSTSIAAPVVALALALAALSASCATAAPVVIGVEVVIDVNAAIQHRADRIRPCTAEVAHNLADRLSKWPFLSYWQYAESAASAGSSFRLRFTVFESLPNEISLRLEQIEGNDVIDRWESEWLQPGKYAAKGYSVLVDPKEIEQAILKYLFSPSYESLVRKRVQGNVPLAEGGGWQPMSNTKEWIVLPLPIGTHESLSHAYLKLVCGWPNHDGDVELLSEVIGSGSYQDGSNSYTGLAVIPELRYFQGQCVSAQQVWSEVREARPVKRVYLERERSGLESLEARKCAGD